MASELIIRYGFVDDGIPEPDHRFIPLFFQNAYGSDIRQVG